MALTRSNPREALKAAVALVRGNAPAVEALDKEAAAEDARIKAEAKRRAEAETKIERDLAARTAALVADWQALGAEAVRLAAEALAREQLQREHGIVPPKVAAMTPAAARLDERRIEQARRRLGGSAAIPWDKQGRSADRFRADLTRAASEAAAPVGLSRAEVETLAAERRAKLEEARQARISDRKQAARAAGLLP
jgi:hypothetical protein